MRLQQVRVGTQTGTLQQRRITPTLVHNRLFLVPVEKLKLPGNLFYSARNIQHSAGCVAPFSYFVRVLPQEFRGDGSSHASRRSFWILRHGFGRGENFFGVRQPWSRSMILRSILLISDPSCCQHSVPMETRAS